jgi:hypothetical protein
MGVARKSPILSQGITLTVPPELISIPTPVAKMVRARVHKK